MNTLISPVSGTKSYPIIIDVCQAVGRCAREGVSRNYYKYSTVFMKLVTLLRKKQIRQVSHCGLSERLPTETVAEERGVESA